MSLYTGHFVPGTGRIRSIQGTNPAAGAEISEPIPTNTVWLVYKIRFQLATDATVATRRVGFFIDDGVNQLYHSPSTAGQAASLTLFYNYFVNFGSFVPAGALVNTSILEPLPYGHLMAGWRIRTSTVNLQAGDDFGAPQLHVEEWFIS